MLWRGPGRKRKTVMAFRKDNKVYDNCVCSLYWGRGEKKKEKKSTVRRYAYLNSDLLILR